MNQPNYPPPRPLPYQANVEELPWLSLLIDSYYSADQGIYEGIRRATQQGQQLACAKGCAHCCRSHTTIPVYPLELVGIYWYVLKQMSPSLQERLQAVLQQHQARQPCPFLLDEACSIHPMRPLACRHFNVFNTPCAPGEDAFYSRRHDVLKPLKKFQNAALEAMLPYHGIKHAAEKRQALKQGTLHSFAMVLQEIPWIKLSERMRPIKEGLGWDT